MAASSRPDTSLLLRAFKPTETWVERGCAYRQWRFLRGEGIGHLASKPELTCANFEVQGVLGQGNYSEVYAALLKSTQKEIALKMIDKAKCKRYKKEDEVLVERWVLTHVFHPSIIVMHHCFQEVGALYMALEKVPGGELWAVSHKIGLPLSLATFYTLQMLEVLQFLHERDIVHRDVKPENVLMCASGHVKVIDFGTAKLLRHPIKLAQDTEDDNKGIRRGKFKEFVGTPEYMSPEAINNKAADQRADLWSLGCFVAQIVTGWPPFKGPSDYLTFKRVLAKKYRLPEGTPPLVASLVDQLCMLNPKERLGGTWSAEAEAVDPATISGGEPRTLGHAAIRSHPLFDAYPDDGRPMYTRPVPFPEGEELALHAVVKRVQSIGPAAFGEGASAQRASVAAMTDKVRTNLMFEMNKRGMLSDEMRELFGLGPPPPPIVDDIDDDLKDDEDKYDDAAEAEGPGGGGDGEGGSEEESDDDDDEEVDDVTVGEMDKVAAGAAAVAATKEAKKKKKKKKAEDGGVVV